MTLPTTSINGARQPLTTPPQAHERAGDGTRRESARKRPSATALGAEERMVMSPLVATVPRSATVPRISGATAPRMSGARATVGAVERGGGDGCRSCAHGEHNRVRTAESPNERAARAGGPASAASRAASKARRAQHHVACDRRGGACDRPGGATQAERAGKVAAAEPEAAGALRARL